jgi:carbonic anhydrase
MSFNGICKFYLHKFANMKHDEILKRLQEGNSRFMADKLEGKLQDSIRRDYLTQGQQPHTIVLSCADSRVVPELAFDVGLGELFVLRVAGNVANTSTIASIEYAVAHCGSSLIVVLGHQSCGAVTAALAGGDNGYNLNHLLAHVAPAISSAPEGSSVNDVVKVNAHKNVEALSSRSPIIGNAVASGAVKIVPAYYNLDSGKVDFL